MSNELHTMSYVLSKHSSEYFIGADEVGTGTIAGPIVVCAVLAKRDWVMEGLNDSKKLSEKKREFLKSKLKDNVIFHISERTSQEVDKGFSNALKLAYQEAFEKVAKKATESVTFLADGNLNIDISKFSNADFACYVKGDTFIPHIMAASILAKTYRDDLMKSYHETYPNYNWIKNKGYGTKEHLDCLEKYGVSELHRKSFEPVKKILEKKVI